MLRRLFILTAVVLMPRPVWDNVAKTFRRGAAAETDVTSAARTATGNSGQIEGADVRAIDSLVDVTVVSGTTPSMTVALEESSDGTTWTQVAITAAITTVSQVRLRGLITRRYYRYVWTITGTTPSFTFSVAADKK